MAMMLPKLLLAVVTVATLSVTVGSAEAQYRYTDDKGVTKTTQYKLDIPSAYREQAEWVGPTGIGKPGLSEEARQTKLRDDAYRRLGEANEQLRAYGGSAYDKPAAAPETSARSSTIKPSTLKTKTSSSALSQKPARPKEVPVMCIAGERQVMTGPGHWEVKGKCGAGDPGSWSSR